LEPVVRAIVVRGKIAREHVEPGALPGDARARPDFAGTVRSRGAPDARRLRALRGSLGDDVDGSAGRSAPVEHRSRAAKNLDALDRVKRDRRPADGREFELVQALSVEEHERVLVAGDTEAPQVDLRVWAAGVVARDDA